MKQFISCSTNQKQHKPIYLILGLTQSCKSSICQSIYPKSIVQTGENVNGQPVTMMPKVFNVNQVNISLIDTVGFKEISKQTIDNTIYKSLKFCVSSNIKQLNGVIVAISIYQNEAELLLKSIVQSLVNCFGLNNLNQIMICLTKINKLETLKQRQKYIQNMKEIVQRLELNPNNIIEFKTNFQIDQQQIVFINQDQYFKKKLLKLSTQIIEIKHRKTKNFEDDFPIHLNVRPKHPGGRHTIIQETDQSLFKMEDFQILDELYKISNFKLVQPSKKHRQTKSEKILKERLIILKSVLGDSFPDLIFRKFISFNDETTLNAKSGFKLYFNIFTDKFRKEIALESQIRQKKLFTRKFEKSNSILQCLFLQNLLKQDIQNDMNIDIQFDEFIKTNQPQLCEQVESYYNLILDKLNFQDFKKIQVKFRSKNEKLIVESEDDLLQFEIKNPILPAPKIKKVTLIRQQTLEPIYLEKQETTKEHDQIYIE